jgi:hypothetical protein
MQGRDGSLYLQVNRTSTTCSKFTYSAIIKLFPCPYYLPPPILSTHSLAINGELTIEVIQATIHAHPTLSEAIRGVAEFAAGHAIHI